MELKTRDGGDDCWLKGGKTKKAQRGKKKKKSVLSPFSDTRIELQYETLIVKSQIGKSPRSRNWIEAHWLQKYKMF